MAGFRNHIWYKLLDEEGVPVSGASIFLYEFNSSVATTNQLNVFDADDNVLVQPLTTDLQGIFDFYVRDYIYSSSTGYTWDQQFLISWSNDDKSGLVQGDHLFGEFESVDISGNLGRLNKALSNYLGWSFERHVDANFGNVHGCGSSSSSSSSVSISSSSSSSTAEVWTSYFDDTRWTALIGSYSPGLNWDSADTGPGGWAVVLQDIGVWTSGYRPTKIRFTSTVSPLFSLKLIDSNGDNIVFQSSPAENTEYTITFGSFDIDKLEITNTGSDWTLTGIEFLEP